MTGIKTIKSFFDREEDIFYLPDKKNKQKFLRALRPLVNRRIFNKNTPVTSSIYLNNDEHEVPWWLSLKLRRYLPSFSRFFYFYPSKKYFFDIKCSKDSDRGRRRKGRYYSEGKTILNYVNRKKISCGSSELCVSNKLRKYILGFFLSMPLRPYIGVEYKRKHYFSEDGYLNITIDEDLSYYYFKKDSKEVVKLGKEDGLRIEIKCPLFYLNNKKYKEVNKIINKFRAIPVISKKYNAYDLLAKYIVDSKGVNLCNEFSGKEIEAKLVVDNKKTDSLLRMIKMKFANKSVPGFVLNKEFPYTLETGNIAEYYVDKNNSKKEKVKLMYKGKWIQTVKKSNQKIDYCQNVPIVVRRESKGSGYLSVKNNSPLSLLSLFSKNFLELKPLNNFFRARKAFWVTKIKSDRRYHISLDYCVTPGSVLSELEVEYSGLPYSVKSPESVSVINKDIAFITKFIISMYPSGTFKKTIMSKFEWILSLN